MSGAPQRVHDVVIVGAGLAGLSAAYQLRARDVVVVEAAPRVGGRVLTRARDGLAYDLGAVFAIDPASVPFDLSLPPPRTESARVGLYAEGSVRYGASALECVEQLGLTPAEAELLARFASDPTVSADALPERLYRPLNAFFRLIHPGDMRRYLGQRQRDALFTFNARHHRGGNRVVLDELMARIGDRVQLGVAVKEIREDYGHVEVVCERAPGQAFRLAARAVICATPGPIARRLITTLTNDRCRVFLERLAHGEGTAVALALEGADVSDFSYVVTPELPVNSVIKHRGRDGEPDLLVAYYVGAASAALAGRAPEDIARVTLEHLRRMKIGALPDEALRFFDVQRWTTVGPVISEESYGRWDPWEARASERVFLAGDYVHVDPENTLPFGTDQAMRSGIDAAACVGVYLDVAPAIRELRARHLIEASIYRMAGAQPEFLETRNEGNVAFYGLLLQARADPQLVRYLTGVARDGLWEYQVGFGVTSEDSLLVLEGLWSAGAAREPLRASLRRLVALFYAPEKGAFQTMSDQRDAVKACAQGRSAYWFGASVDATAVAAFLLSQVDPEPHGDIIRACARYVADAQTPAGGWRSTWFPASAPTTYHAVRLLARCGDAYGASLERARVYLLSSQGTNGSWRDSVIETAGAVLALSELDGDHEAAIAAACAWIRSRRRADGWDGEPVLYYWFEIGADERLFFHCRDRGEVTSAWATLALRAAPSS